MTSLRKLPKNMGNLVKTIAATVFKKLPKVQQIAQSGHMVLLNPLTLCKIPPTRNPIQTKTKFELFKMEQNTFKQCYQIRQNFTTLAKKFSSL